MSVPTYYRDIEMAEAEVTALKDAYLRRWGWRPTSNTPGAYWLWVRDFTEEDKARHHDWRERGPGPLGWPSEPTPYGVITATTDMAVQMTARSLDTHAENAREEEE